MSPNDADEMANSVDPDQTAPLGLHCLPRYICHYGIILKNFLLIYTNSILPQFKKAHPRHLHT